MSKENIATISSQSFDSSLFDTKTVIPVENTRLACQYVDNACQTEEHLFQAEKESDTRIYDDFDFIIKGHFSSFFKKEDKTARKDFLLCQEKLKSIDREFLKCAIDGDLSSYTKDEINTKFTYIFDEVLDPLSTTLETINRIEPKQRLLLSVRLSNIMAGVIVALISASMFLLPALFPSFFVAGTLSYAALHFLNREGTFTLNLSGILLSIYQWIANKQDNDALQEFEDFRARLTRINTYLDNMRSKVMYSQICTLSSQVNEYNTQMNSRVNEYNTQMNSRMNDLSDQISAQTVQTNNISNQISEIKNAQANYIKHEEITAEEIREIKRQQKEILMRLSQHHHQAESTTPASYPSTSQQINNPPGNHTHYLADEAKCPDNVNDHTYNRPSIMQPTIGNQNHAT